MNEFLSQIKNEFNSSKEVSFLLINTFQMQIIILMFMGTSLEFFRGLQFFSNQHMPNLTSINISIFVLQSVMFLVIFWEINEVRNRKNKRENIKKVIAQFIKCYKNILMIPAFYISFKSIKSSENATMIIMGVINILIGTFFCYIKEICCVSYRFRVRNYFRKFGSTVVDMLLIILIIAIDCFEGSHYGAIVMLFKNIFRLSRLYHCFEQPIVQKLQIFYNLYQLMICTIIITASSLDYNFQQNLTSIGAVLVFGGIIIGHSTQTFSFSIYNRMISTSSLLLMQEQVDNIQDNQQGMIKKHFNQIRVMSMIYLEKEKYQEKEENQFNKWWQFFNRKVLIHKINCANPKCKCLLKKLPDSDIQIFLKQLISDIRRLSITYSKEMKLKIMTIYMYIEILRRPLKAYYELMRLKSQKKADSFDIELADLSTQTRECFDQLFLKNKVKNQKLQLFKVIQFEQHVQQCESDLKKIITQTMQFYSNFNYNTIKISQIKQESNTLQRLKVSFQKKLLKILNDYSSNLKVTVLIHLFYNYINVYQNKQSQLKKISHQQLFKKRIFDKKQINVFSPQFGSIFIDLVQQRGKIKNLTKNMCTVYGYPKQDMVNYNVNLFMPRLFGKHHAKFLHNFIEKGKFRLLKESFRSVFGKNKRKFLFPMKITLKAEYLLDNFFGSSSLLRPTETFSQFIIVDKYGKIEEMTQGIYKRIFLGSFKEENQKVARLHINKLIPSYNVFYESGEQRATNYDKIIQGTFLYCEDGNYLIEKFKFIKDFNRANRNLTTNNSNNNNNNNNYTMSIVDLSNSTLVYSKQEQEINLNDAMKYFLMDLEMFILKAVKIAYKVTPVVTAEFQAQLLQIVSIKPYSNQQVLYQSILDELGNLLEMFNFQLDDRELIKSHLDKLQTQLQSKQYEYLQSHSVSTTQADYNNSMNNLMGQDAPRQVKKATKLTFQDIQSVQFEDNRLFDQQNELAQKMSFNNSSVDTLQGQSKRQILVNAFSNGDKKIINSKFSKIAYLAIFVLLALLVTLLVESVVFLDLVAQDWKSINHIAQMKKILQYRKSLIEIQQYQQLTNQQDTSLFINTQIQQLNNKFKEKVERIYQSVVKQEKFNQFYTEQFVLENSLTKQKENVSFILLLKQILWRFSYSVQQSREFLREYYQSITRKFSLLQQSQQHFLLETEYTNLLSIYMINMTYLVVVILVGLGVLPVFFYFKNQQKTMIQLLEYISFSQLKKSLRKLNLIQSQLNKLDRIDNFEHVKNEIKSSMLLLGRDNNLNEHSITTSKSPRIVASTANKNSAKSLTKSICVGVFIIVFLSNLPVLTMLQLGYVSMQFRESVNINQMVYKLQAKPAMLINVYLMNVNNILKNKQRIEISLQLEQDISIDYFTPQTLLSRPINNKLTISQQLFPLLQQSVCQYLQQPCMIDRQVTFNYLVYLFKNKFQFLSQQKNHLIKLTDSVGSRKDMIDDSRKDMIDEWIVENNIQQIVQKINQVIIVSEQVNQQVFTEYSNKFNVNIYSLIAVGTVLIVLNTIVLLIVLHLTFDHYDQVLKQTQNVFRHFDLDTLSQNTYLTSYFNAKIKDSK